MRKEVSIMLFITLSFHFTGCGDDSLQTNGGDDSRKAAGFLISSDASFLAARQFLNANYPETKSLHAGKVEVQTVWRSLTFNDSPPQNSGSRSICREEVPVYIFSLKTSNDADAGYVVSAGDKRVQDRLIAFSDEGKWNLSGIPEFEALFWENVDNYLVSALSKSETDECNSYEYYAHKSDDVKMVSGSLLRWGQSASPYNDSVPACSSGGNSLAGCVAIAMGQIMAYHGSPASGSYIHPQHGRTVHAQYDWESMKEQGDAREIATASGRNGVANVIAEAGVKANMSYGCNSSLALIRAAISSFRQMGYTSSSLASFNMSQIKNDIDNKRPVYIRGSNSSGGHAWIIEGYCVTKFDIIYVKECPDEAEAVSPSVIGSLSQNYLYFNLGWHGDSNGFYSATLFSDWPFQTNGPQIIHSISPQS